MTSVFDGFRWQASMGADDLKIADDETRERLGELVTLRFTKSNYSRKPDPLTLRRDDHGALVPLDVADLELVATVKSGAAERVAKRNEREQERELTRNARERADAERRAVKEAERKALIRRRDEADDEAARAAIDADPEGSVRAWAAVMKKVRQCGTTRALDSIHRVRGER